MPGGHSVGGDGQRAIEKDAEVKHVGYGAPGQGPAVAQVESLDENDLIRRGYAHTVGNRVFGGMVKRGRLHVASDFERLKVSEQR
jgi:hypothetical protein